MEYLSLSTAAQRRIKATKISPLFLLILQIGKQFVLVLDTWPMLGKAHCTQELLRLISAVYKNILSVEIQCHATACPFVAMQYVTLGCF